MGTFANFTNAMGCGGTKDKQPDGKDTEEKPAAQEKPAAKDTTKPAADTKPTADTTKPAADAAKENEALLKAQKEQLEKLDLHEYHHSDDLKALMQDYFNRYDLD